MNTYVPSKRAPKHIKGDTDGNTIIENFNTSLTSMGRSNRQNISKGTLALNNMLDQIDLMDMYRTFHPNIAEHTFFSTAHRIFSRMNHKTQ